MEFKISQELAQKVLDYISSRPYGEVKPLEKILVEPLLSLEPVEPKREA